jgi:L-ribulose-5-phosphate 3-epimerase
MTMKRRDFLTKGAAGMAGLSMGSMLLKPESAVAAKAEKTGQRVEELALKKGYMLGTFPNRNEYSVMQQFRMLRDAGFEGVEPDSGLDRTEVLRAAEETGLEIPSIVVSTHWSQPLSSPDPAVRQAGLDGLEVALEDAHEYGAKRILLVPGRVTEETTYDVVYQRSQSEISKMVPLAEELGVTIAIENVWNRFLLSPLEAAKYVDEFNSDAVGWYFDIGNLMNYGWPQHWIRILGKRISMIHIKEYSMEKRNSEGPGAGFRVNYLEGDNNWPEIMEALRDVGYSGEYGIAEPPYREEEIPHDRWLKEYVSDRMDEIFSM